MSRLPAMAVFIVLCWPSPSFAAGEYYAGALGGIATLSADARSIVASSGTSVSLYKPENGPTLNFFMGRHLSDYLSLQASYIWNRNDLTLSATSFSSQGQLLYQETRNSSQQSVLGDLLLYFRNRKSFARPYLSAGTGFVRLRSTEQSITALAGTPKLPPKQFTSTALPLRVAVGIDLAVARGWAIRYSFAEAIGSDAISAQLSPPGQRNLKNFQNLFGFVKTF